MIATFTNGNRRAGIPSESGSMRTLSRRRRARGIREIADGLRKNGSEWADRPMRRPASFREARRMRFVRPTLLLVVTAVSLYLLLPSLLAVFGSWRAPSGA